MRNFNQFRRGGGGDSNRGGGGGRFSNFRDGDRQMHPATCASCGKDCQVPFRPSGDKPIYCSDCFAQQGGGSDRKSFGNSDRPRGERTFRGGGDRPFRREGSDRPRPQVPDYKRDFELINLKLDTLLAAVNSLNSPTHKPAKAKKAKAPKAIDVADTNGSVEPSIKDLISQE